MPISIPAYQIESVPPDTVDPKEDTLVVGTSISGALFYGMDFTKDFKLAVCADGIADLIGFYSKLIKNIMDNPTNRLVLIDGGRECFDTIIADSNCKYIKSSDELSEFFEEIKPELNDRLENNGNGMAKLFLLIPDYNRFFEMVADEQADFMRKITRHINAPVYGIYFICGFDINKEKSGDSLFFDLLIEAENYVLCPRSYPKVGSKITGIPVIKDARSTDSYFCQRDKNVKIRW
jgi:hypothetical protein